MRLPRLNSGIVGVGNGEAMSEVGDEDGEELGVESAVGETGPGVGVGEIVGCGVAVAVGLTVGIGKGVEVGCGVGEIVGYGEGVFVIGRGGLHLEHGRYPRFTAS